MRYHPGSVGACAAAYLEQARAGRKGCKQLMAHSAPLRRDAQPRIEPGVERIGDRIKGRAGGKEFATRHDQPDSATRTGWGDRYAAARCARSVQVS